MFLFHSVISMGIVQAHAVDTSLLFCLFSFQFSFGAADSLVVCTHGPLSAPLRGRGLCQHRTTHWAPISPMVGTGTVSTKRRGAGTGVRKGRPSTSGLLGCPSARQNNLKVLELGIARGARPRADPLDSPAQDGEVVVGTRPCWVHTF